jgi:hypothetical protein
MKHPFVRITRWRFCLIAGVTCWIALGQPAKAVDEIQVYNANIAAPGQFTIQQHLNYVGLALQLPFMEVSESMGNHDSKIVDAGSVD